MGTDLDLEIKQTRVGGFGSSDAKMIAKIGRTGVVNETAKLRIAQMLGLEPIPEVSSAAMENGKKREQEIFNWLSTANKVSNPYCEYPTNYSFKVFNHIDIEVEADEVLTWYEIKTSKFTVEETIANYIEQLAWHFMLLEEKAASLISRNRYLILLHYEEDYTGSSFNEENITFVNIQVSQVRPYALLILKGLGVIEQAITDGFAANYNKREELVAFNLSPALQEEMSVIHSGLVLAEKAQKQAEDFKLKILELMEQNGITAPIRTPYFDIVYVAPTVAETFDSKAFKRFDGDTYNKFKKTTNRKSYVKLNLKGV